MDDFKVSEFTEPPSEEIIDKLIELADMDLTPEQEELVRNYWRTTDPKDYVKPVTLEPQKIDVMQFDPHGSKGAGVYCSCGQSKVHQRRKVMMTWAQRHFTKTGHNWVT